MQNEWGYNLVTPTQSNTQNPVLGRVRLSNGHIYIVVEKNGPNMVAKLRVQYFCPTLYLILSKMITTSLRIYYDDY